jgi:hypothetical protein
MLLGLLLLLELFTTLMADLILNHHGTIQFNITICPLQNQIIDSNIKIASNLFFCSTDIRGVALKASETIKKDKVLMKIKITTKNTISIRNFHSILEKNKFQHQHEILNGIGKEYLFISLLVLYYRYDCDKNDDFLHSYVMDVRNRFPKFHGILDFSPKEMKEFQSSYLRKRRKHKINQLNNFLHKFENSSFSKYFQSSKCEKSWKDIFTKKEMIWSLGFLYSRVFKIKLPQFFQNSENHHILIPFLDQPNTDENPNVKLVYFSKYSLSLKTKYFIPKGMELTMNYPTTSNYVEHYGFCMENNYHSKYIFDMKNQMKSIIQNIRDSELKILAKSIFQQNQSSFSLWKFSKKNGIYSIPFPLLTFIRSILSSERKMRENLKLIGKLKKNIFLSLKNELKTLKQLKLMLLSNLVNYSTSIEEDEKELQGNVINPKVRCAIIIRRDEKMILKKIISQIDLLTKPNVLEKWTKSKRIQFLHF